jgi:Trk-type K+ transport system membrane component
MRRQMTSDIWPLCAAIFGICIFERGKLMDPEKASWFTIFRIIFECTSAYSTIGLSLGVPTNNYSFCGDFGTVSKLIVSMIIACVVGEAD